MLDLSCHVGSPLPHLVGLITLQASSPSALLQASSRYPQFRLEAHEEAVVFKEGTYAIKVTEEGAGNSIYA